MEQQPNLLSICLDKIVQTTEISISSFKYVCTPSNSPFAHNVAPSLLVVCVITARAVSTCA
jgi:hypothetical protein